MCLCAAEFKCEAQWHRRSRSSVVRSMFCFIGAMGPSLSSLCLFRILTFIVGMHGVRRRWLAALSASARGLASAVDLRRHPSPLRQGTSRLESLQPRHALAPGPSLSHRLCCTPERVQRRALLRTVA